MAVKKKRRASAGNRTPRSRTDSTKTATAPIKGERGGELFARVASILDQARAHVVRAIDSNMVVAYWLIGREIVEAVQGGEERAAYGLRVITELAERLTARYGKGFSVSNLKYFRQFYQVYADRSPQIGHTVGGQLQQIDTKEVLADLTVAIEARHPLHGFSPTLSWSHYRTLCMVDNSAERTFYEIEADKCGWSKRTLERQIHTSLFARLLKSRDKGGIESSHASGSVQLGSGACVVRGLLRHSLSPAVMRG